MTHLKHPGIVATWKLKINRKHYIRVFVWDTAESLWAAKDYNVSFEAHAHLKHEHNYIGDATSCIQAINEETGKRKIPKKFGEIFVIAGNYRSEIASHEIAHMVNYWGESQGWNPYGKDDEKVARITGRLNAQFWTEHYKVFK